MKTVILTGASGFIGRHCIPLLIDHGFEVHAITSRKKPCEDSGIYWHTTDLSQPNQVQNMMKKICPTHLLHFAWYTIPGKYWSAPDNIQWVDTSVNLVREFSDAGGERMVGAGTCAEYDWSQGYCLESTTPIKPQTQYGISKNSFHIKAREIQKNAKQSYAWGRIFFLYGPFENPTRLVPSIINPLLRGESAPCTVGNQIRDYLFVEDVAEAFVRLLDSSVTGPVNIASGKPITIKTIIELIGEKTHRKELIRYGQLPTLLSEAPIIVADNNRLINDVGWHQRNDLSTGLDKTIAWWKKILR
jgi:nucleoside-diphosphate-sugar epimerase